MLEQPDLERHEYCGQQEIRCSRQSMVAWSLLILTLIIAVYLCIDLVLPRFVSWFTLVYIIKPLSWLGIAIVTLVVAKRVGLFKSLFKEPATIYPAVIAFLQVMLLFTAGMFLGFGRSPYLFTPKALLMNFFMISFMLVGTEISRAYLVKACAKRYFASGIAVISSIYAIINIPIDSLLRLDGSQQGIIFMATKLLPSFAESLLASLLAFVGGPVASIAYRGIIQAFEWFSPVLPNLPWIASALIGVLFPITAIVALGVIFKDRLPQPVSENASTAENRKPGNSAGIVGWLAMASVGLLMTWFFAGVFGVKPFLIVSRSMTPSIQLGDIVVTKPVGIQSIKPGDIIQFRMTGESSVVHRVIEVKKTKNDTFFITKGDANATEDTKPVYAKQVTGRVTYIIPKIGWVAIGVKNTIASLVD